VRFGPLESPRKAHARDLFAGLPSAYDRAGALLSFGQDPRWRRTMVDALRVTPSDRVLDVAAGTGLVTAALRQTYDCDVVALDQSPEMLARAEERFRYDTRVRVVLGEAEWLPFADGEFDALTFTYLLRYVDDVPATLRELMRVVRPGGRVASLEFGVPSSPVWRAGWWGVTRTVLPVAGCLISRDWWDVGRFLGPNIEEFARTWPPERLAEAWIDAGMARVAVRRMSFGSGVVMWGARSTERA
jgi:demethylmenaquinone methyltransferase/2-methoxy-6-polyprenyl-1,4-benzoquinol methylase